MEATTTALEQKMKLNEGGKVFPVGGNVARKAHRNDNPHLDRLHPPQMEELVAQKQQIMPPPNPHQLANQELCPRVLPVPMQKNQSIMMSKNDELQMEHLETSGIKEINQKLVDISFTELTAKTDDLFVARIRLRTLVPTEVVYKITAKNDDESRDCSVTGK